MVPERRRKVTIRKEWQKSAKGCWSLSLGERGCRVRIFQREQEGQFFRETWVGKGRGRAAAALHTRNRVEAQRLGEAFFEALLQGDRPSADGPLTLKGLWTRYQEECPAYRLLDERSREERKHDAALLLAAFGGSKPVEHLTLAGVEHYVEVRRSEMVGKLYQCRTGPSPANFAFCAPCFVGRLRCANPTEVGFSETTLSEG
jgi:hypothetical protein